MRGLRASATAVAVAFASMGSAGIASLASATPSAATPSCTDSWLVAADGTWSTAANWSTGLVPNTAYDIGPSGTAFATPVTLTTKYSPGALPAGAVASQLAIFTVSNGAWTAVPGSTVNAAASTVTASLSHFSTYAILAPNSFAGTFIGRYSGAYNGNFQMNIFPTGSIQLSGVDAIDGPFSGTGALTLTGAASVQAQGSGGAATGGTFTFSGTFQNAGGSVTAQGTYSTQFQGKSGGNGSWSIP